MPYNPKSKKNLILFKEGHDDRRNMDGPPKKLPELDILLAEVLGDEKDGITAAKAILMALRNRALKKTGAEANRAAEILLERGYGKVKQDYGITTNQEQACIKLPDGTIIQI